MDGVLAASLEFYTNGLRGGRHRLIGGMTRKVAFWDGRHPQRAVGIDFDIVRAEAGIDGEPGRKRPFRTLRLYTRRLRPTLLAT